MSNTKRTRRPFAAVVERASHGGIQSVHRFGTSGQWGPGSSSDVVYAAELVSTSAEPPYFRCGDCDSITTGLRSSPGGPYELIGITHSPGCPWLTAAARTWEAS